MTHLRERWEGVSLCGKYRLERWLGAGEGAAFFQTSLAPDGRRAVVKLIPEAAVDGAEPLNLWHRIRQLRHPNLVELLDCGRADLEGEIAFYALFESPDDTLSSALSRSPLSREEAREVLESVIAALRYLHAQGLAAGALDPDHIVAVGEQVKLSTGALREAENSSVYREDVRLLGELWQRALMPASAKSAEIAAHAADPNLEARWSLAEISAALAEGYEAEPVPAAPAPALLVEAESPVSAPVVSEAAVSEPAISETPISETRAEAPPAPAAPVIPVPPRNDRRASEPAASSGFPKWILVAAACVLFVILNLHWLHTAKAPAQSRVTSVSPPRETVAPEPRQVMAPAARQIAPPAFQTGARSSSSDDQKIWRVIAFTYHSREEAVKKAQQLNDYHPGIDAAVFRPKEKGRYYLVSLGGRMSREEAERLRRTARGRGLPRDLYVQNYTR